MNHRDELLEDAYYFLAILEEGRVGRAIDFMTVPKDQKQMRKLAKRGTVGHIAHGALRMAAGAPAFAGGGIANAARYAVKVRNAKRGLYRHSPGNAGD